MTREEAQRLLITKLDEGQEFTEIVQAAWLAGYAQGLNDAPELADTP